MEGYKTEMEIVTLGRGTMKESTSFFVFLLSRLMNWKFWLYLSRICIAAPMWNVIPNVRIESTIRKIPKCLLKKTRKTIAVQVHKQVQVHACRVRCDQ